MRPHEDADDLYTDEELKAMSERMELPKLEAVKRFGEDRFAILVRQPAGLQGLTEAEAAEVIRRAQAPSVDLVKVKEALERSKSALGLFGSKFGINDNKTTYLGAVVAVKEALSIIQRAEG